MLLNCSQCLFRRMKSNTAQKMKFSAGLVTFTEDILNSKLHFFVQCKVFIAQSEIKAKNDKIPQN